MSRSTPRLPLAVFALVAVGASCTTPAGLLYTHTVVPLTTNFDRTPVDGEAVLGDVKAIRYQGIEVNWDSNAIGEIARQHGLEEVYFADLETLSILGVWTQEWVHVYGK